MHPPDGQAERVPRVLAIDQDPHILSQVRRILERDGYETITATSGHAGMSLFLREAPDIVLLEIEIADLGGQDLLSQMKERRRYVPVIILASASEMAAVASLRRGADDYLSKPLAPDELLDRVQFNLEKGRRARTQAELTQQLRRQLSMLISVREVAHETSTTVDLFTLLQSVLKRTMYSMQLDAGIIFVSENGELVPLAYRGLPQSIAAALARRRISWEDPALQPYQQIAQAVRTRAEEQRGGPLSQAVGYGFTAIVPMWAQGQLWGFMEVAAQEERSVPTQDLELLTTVGHQVAIALANARLQETAALRVRELALLNETCLALTSDLSLEQILTTAMLRTSDVIGVETGSLLLVDESDGELVFRISLGGDAERILSLRVPSGQGIAGWVFQQGEPLLVPDVHKDDRYYPEIDHHTGFRTRSILCVPMRVRGKTFGVIELVNKILGEFSEDDLRLLESVAALTATAIEQSRLNEWTNSFVMVDPLTHLPNHRLLLMALEREAARCRRYTRACSLVMLGVDRRLHMGESQWAELTSILKKSLRQSDMVCRHRDGPFAILLPETGAEGAHTLTSRLREDIRRATLMDIEEVDLSTHIRFGTASFPDDVEDPKDLLGQAEAALSQAWQESP